MEGSVQKDGIQDCGAVNSVEFTSSNRGILSKSKSMEPSRSKKGSFVELTLLCIALCVIWVLLALPIIFFFLPVDEVVFPQVPSFNGSFDNGSGSGMEVMSSLPAATVNATPLTCNEAQNFFFSELTQDCAPRCPTWSQHDRTLSQAIDKVVLVSSCIGVISAVVVLIVSCMRHKHMFGFPSVFVVYLTGSLLVFGIFFVVNFIDREHLFCASEDLRISVLDPAPFCIIAGVIFYYFLIQITLWWFFHIAALFWAFRFPLNFRSFQKLKRMRYIHLASVILAFILPVIPVVVTIGDYATDEKGPRTPKGMGFGITNFPPILCAGIDADATFYSLLLPIMILEEIGMTLLVFTFWDVRKNHAYQFRKAIKRKTSCFKIGSGEKKIVIVLLYYAILLEFTLMAFTLSTRNISSFRTAVLINFICESFGFNPDAPCDRSLIDDLKYPGVNLVAYTMLGLFPVINFTYVVKFRILKKWFCHYVLRQKESSNLESRATAESRFTDSSITLQRVNAIGVAKEPV